MGTVVKLPRQPSETRTRNLYRGCLLGGAVGDALGAPVEFMSDEEIFDRFGAGGIRNFAPAYGRIGAITDDTQMTLFTAEGVLRGFLRERAKGLCHPAGVIAYAYLRWLNTQGERHPKHRDCLDGWLITNTELFARRGPGNTCLSALRALREVGQRAKNNSKGCGGVMRVAPVGMLFAALSPSGSRESIRSCFEIACDAAAITHGHPTGQLSSGAMALIVMGLLIGHPLRESVREALAVVRERPGHSETVEAIEKALRLADEAPGDPRSVRRLGEGWVAEEALAIGLYCALGAASFRAGVELAVNHGGDSDSTGSIAGQLLGAIHGVKAIPRRWLEELELSGVLRAVADDLGSVTQWRLDDSEADAEESFYWARFPAW
jgi:ADP-ribosyl-[dinitrogen reductase] hydrolase